VSIRDDGLELAARVAPRDPEELEAGAASADAKLSPLTSLGAVYLTVSDLERSLSYYRDAVGLEAVDHRDGRVSLGRDGRVLLVLVEEMGARSAVGYTGLYHFALLVPERADLARWLAHAARDRVPLVGLSDHFVSEALYLSDPDGHGIEIYWDRPREHWEGQVAAKMTTLPLDVNDLFGELANPEAEPFDGLPSDTVMGHVHLKVADIPKTIEFYRDVLGFALMAQLGSQAAFLSAGGYHHHIGANTWESAGAGPAPPATASLRHATIVLPSDDERERILRRVQQTGQRTDETEDGPLVRDPSGNRLLLGA
jgi:catechol 2,3-dioxygenase